MTRQFSSDVERLIQQRMATGKYSSEEELFAHALHALDEDDQELKAIEEGLASVDRGEIGVSLDDAFDRLRRKHLTQDKA